MKKLTKDLCWKSSSTNLYRWKSSCLRQALFILSLLLLASCLLGNEQTSHSLTAPLFQRRLVAFGDSHTYGTGVQPMTYINTVAQKLLFEKISLNLNSKFNYTFLLDNQSMGGSAFDSQWQHQRIVTYQFQSSDIVTMLLGYNDVVYYGTDAGKLDIFKSELQEALLHISQAGAQVFIGTCIKPPLSIYELLKQDGIKDGKDLSHGSYEACDLYSQTIRGVAAQFQNVTVVETAQMKLTESDMIDHAHFKASIHDQIADLFIHEINLKLH